MTEPGIDIEKVAKRIGSFYGSPDGWNFAYQEIKAVQKAERERCAIAVQEYRSHWCPMDFENKDDLIKHMERWCLDKILSPNGETK